MIMFNWFKKKNKFDIENPKFIAFDSHASSKEFKRYANDNNTCTISSFDKQISVTIRCSNAMEAYNKCKIAIESILLNEYKNDNSMNLNKFINSNLWQISLYQSL